MFLYMLKDECHGHATLVLTFVLVAILLANQWGRLYLFSDLSIILRFSLMKGLRLTLLSISA